LKNEAYALHSASFIYIKGFVNIESSLFGIKGRCKKAVFDLTYDFIEYG